jgi:hypothetical protein
MQSSRELLILAVVVGTVATDAIEGILAEGPTAVIKSPAFDSEDNDIPAIWLIHLPVGDIAESLRRVQECGGQVIKESAEAGYAVVRDPVGVYLARQAG